MKRINGFTLIETSIVVIIILILFAISVPFYTYFQSFSTVEAGKQEVTEIIRQAQTQAVAGFSNGNWGVYFLGTTFTLYQGDNYNLREISLDTSYSLESNQTFSGLQDINFTKKTGTPTESGTIVITNENNNHMEFISINDLGLIE